MSACLTPLQPISRVAERCESGRGDGNDVKITFDLAKRNSKFTSAGFDLFIPDGFGPGVDLTLTPLPVPDPDFPAHVNCRNLNP